MTWLKLGQEFGDETVDLADDAFRVHVEGLSLAMRLEKGPVLPKWQVHKWVSSDNPEAVIRDELVPRGFWRDLGEDYEIVHHMEHQPEAAVLAARRRMAAERQRRFRHKAAGVPVPEAGGRDE